jgi:DNA-binding response OmpR family regulator
MEELNFPQPVIKILIIEDDDEMRSLLKDFLEEEGYGVDTVGDGSEAFRGLARESFDVVLTDIRMPGLTGFDILPGIRKLQPKASVIVITAFGSEEVHQKVFERGADAYLEKPIYFQKLKNLIVEMISSREKMVRR